MPFETELLQQFGLLFLYNVEELSIGIFFYGTSSSLVVYGPSTSSIKGIFLALFSASVAIFVFVFSSLRVAYFFPRPDPPNSHRRRGFSNRAIAAMFVVTVINFLLFSLTVGTAITISTVSIRKALILDTEHPPPELEGPGLATNTLQDLNTVLFWSVSIPVSSNLSLPDSVLIHARWRYYRVI